MNMSDRDNRAVDEIRIWSVLDKMDKRLHAIELTLQNLVRLDERVNNHDKLIDRMSAIWEDHDRRIRDNEMAYSSIGVKDESKSQSLSRAFKAIETLQVDFNNLKSKLDSELGKKKVFATLLNWSLGILSGYIIFKIKAS